MKIEIHNGRLIDPAHGVDRKSSLYIAAGKVAALDEPPPGWHPNRVIDASRSPMSWDTTMSAPLYEPRNRINHCFASASRWLVGSSSSRKLSG